MEAGAEWTGESSFLSEKASKETFQKQVMKEAQSLGIFLSLTVKVFEEGSYPMADSWDGLGWTRP